MQLLPPNLLPKEKATPVTSYADIADDVSMMLRALDEGIVHHGRLRGAIALAHAQVSRTPYNFFVLDKRYKHLFDDRRVIINPTILEQNNLVPFLEGCLSFDVKEAHTRRFRNLKVKWSYPDGTLKLHWPREDTFEGLAAMVLQHEIDHANGKNIHEEFAEFNR